MPTHEPDTPFAFTFVPIVVIAPTIFENTHTNSKLKTTCEELFSPHTRTETRRKDSKLSKTRVKRLFYCVHLRHTEPTEPMSTRVRVKVKGISFELTLSEGVFPFFLGILSKSDGLSGPLISHIFPTDRTSPQKNIRYGLRPYT